MQEPAQYFGLAGCVLQMGWDAEASGSCISLLAPVSRGRVLHCRAARCAQSAPHGPGEGRGAVPVHTQHGEPGQTLLLAWSLQHCPLWGGPLQAVFASGLQLIAGQRARTGKSTAGMGPVPTGRVQDGC